MDGDRGMADAEVIGHTRGDLNRPAVAACLDVYCASFGHIGAGSGDRTVGGR